MDSIIKHLQLTEHPDKASIERMVQDMEQWQGIMVILHKFNYNTYISAQVKGLLGYNKTEWDNDFLSSVTHPDDVYGINEKMGTYLLESSKPFYDKEGPNVLKLFGRLQHTNGKYIPIEFTGVILEYHENGAFKTGLGVYQDISGRQKDQSSKLESEKLTRRVEAALLEIKKLYHNTYPCDRISPVTSFPKTKKDNSKIHIVDMEELEVKIKHGIEVQMLLRKQRKTKRDSSLLTVNNQGVSGLQFINKVVQFIEENLDNPELTTNLLASNLNMSRTHLHRKIKNALGIPSAELIKKIRIDKASYLLKQEEHTVTDVAYSVGFNDSSYFTKCFRQAYGVTPSEYKKN